MTPRDVRSYEQRKLDDAEANKRMLELKTTILNLVPLLLALNMLCIGSIILFMHLIGVL